MMYRLAEMASKLSCHHNCHHNYHHQLLQLVLPSKGILPFQCHDKAGDEDLSREQQQGGGCVT